MTKNEIIRELTKCNPRLIGRLFISYHDKKTNTEYKFTYEDTLSHISSQGETRELVRVLSSLYKLRRYVECIRVVYWVRISESDWLERYYGLSNYVYSVSDFIKSIKK